MTKKQLLKIWEKTDGHCHFCGDPVDFEKRGYNVDDQKGHWEVDHVIQKGKGGRKSVDNCLPSCTRCNRLRWHRKGEDIRELLLLGLIAQKEVRKSSIMGNKLQELKTKKLQENRRRRKA
jgi:5-methylcytosine-specific restriction endonuclease McrA